MREEALEEEQSVLWPAWALRCPAFVPLPRKEAMHPAPPFGKDGFA